MSKNNQEPAMPIVGRQRTQPLDAQLMARRSIVAAHHVTLIMSSEKH
jgi:hypothetical protein